MINPIPFATTFGVWGFNLAAKGVVQLIKFFATLTGGMAPDIEEPELELPVNVWDIPIIGWPFSKSFVSFSFLFRFNANDCVA